MHDAYDRMRYMDGTERRDNSKKLYWLLGGLLVVIIGLVVGVVVVNIKSDGDGQSEKIVLNSGSISEDILVRLGLEDEIIIDYEGNHISSAIIDVYNEGNEEEAIELFDKTIEEAFSHRNFDLFLVLITDRANLLRRTDRCDEATKLFDLYDVSDYSRDEQLLYYGEAQGQFFMCNNNERFDAYSQKVNQLLESEGIETDDRQ